MLSKRWLIEQEQQLVKNALSSSPLPHVPPLDSPENE